MRYNFDWHPVKEQKNIRKHGVSFRQAATVFPDPNQVSIYDEEERWITIGLDSTGVLRVVIHTYEQVDQSICQVRIISARKATVQETQQYRLENL